MFEFNVVYAAFKSNFAAEFNDLGAHPLHHGHQTKGANVRPADKENLLWSSRCNKLPQHLASVVLWILHLAVQLAIGECAGAAFTKLRV